MSRAADPSGEGGAQLLRGHQSVCVVLLRTAPQAHVLSFQGVALFGRTGYVWPCWRKGPATLGPSSLSAYR